MTLFYHVVLGSNGADSLEGTAGDDLIVSGAGNDTIAADGGNDLILAGRGVDVVTYDGAFDDYRIATRNGWFLDVAQVELLDDDGRRIETDLLLNVEKLFFTADGITLLIDGSNNPVLAGDDSATTAADSPLTLTAATLLANDRDLDGDALSLIAVDATSASGASVSLVDGEVRYDAGGAFADLAAGATATDTFDYTVTDGNGSQVSATVSVTVTGVASGPAASDVTVSTDEDTVLDLSAADLLGADGADLLFSDVSGGQGAVTVNADGTLSYDPSSAFNSLAEGESAADSFTYTVRDAAGNEASAEIVVNIDGRNDAPLAADDTLELLLEANQDGGALTFTLDDLLANDTDPDNGDTLTLFEIAGVDPDGGTILPSGAGVAFDDANDRYSYLTLPNNDFENLQPGETATDSFTYTVMDAQGAMSTATVNVNIEVVDPSTIV